MSDWMLLNVTIDKENGERATARIAKSTAIDAPCIQIYSAPTDLLLEFASNFDPDAPRKIVHAYAQAVGAYAQLMMTTKK